MWESLLIPQLKSFVTKRVDLLPVSSVHCACFFGFLCDHIDFICTHHQDVNTLVLNKPIHLWSTLCGGLVYFFDLILLTSVGRDMRVCHQEFWRQGVGVPVFILSVFDSLPLVRESAVSGKSTYPPPCGTVTDDCPLRSTLYRLLFPAFYFQICSACQMNILLWI